MKTIWNRVYNLHGVGGEKSAWLLKDLVRSLKWIYGRLFGVLVLPIHQRQAEFEDIQNKTP